MYDLYESDSRKKNPKISVVMSIYNGAKFLEQSIESLNSQTDKDHEVIIINDCSTDDTKKKLEKMLKNNRIDLIIENKQNVGLTKSLNIGVKHSNGKFIARQDVDDISFPDRLEKQSKFIDSYDLIGGLSLSTYENSNKRIITGSKNNNSLTKTIFLKSPFTHSSAFFRKDKFIEVGGYNEDFVVSQDFELWMRFAKNGKVGVMDDVIVQRHVHDNMISRKIPFKQIYFSNKARFLHPQRGYFLPIFYFAQQIITLFIPRTIKELIKNFYNENNQRVE